MNVLLSAKDGLGRCHCIGQQQIPCCQKREGVAATDINTKNRYPGNGRAKSPIINTPERCNFRRVPSGNHLEPGGDSCVGLSGTGRHAPISLCWGGCYTMHATRPYSDEVCVLLGKLLVLLESVLLVLAPKNIFCGKEFQLSLENAARTKEIALRLLAPSPMDAHSL